MAQTTKDYSIQNILFPSFSSNPDGISGDLFFRGCKRHCRGCHNPELQEFKEPNTSLEDILKAINNNGISILTLMGGEPLDQDTDTLVGLVTALKLCCPELKISIYTGYELKDIPQELLDRIDYIKTGEYDDTKLISGDNQFLASSNQVFYKKINGEFTPYGV